MSLPPLRVRPEDWRPTGVRELEPNALLVATGLTNCAVLAGPGAGKTELLAQRAAFLLQTGTSTAPRRILAISFKRDAARNLAERVRKRCHRDHTARFDSMTFDAFAKGLIDRFGQALPERWRPTPDYEIISPKPVFFQDFLNRAAQSLTSPDQVSKVRKIYFKGFERSHVLDDALQEAGWPGTTAGAWAGQRFWDEMLRTGPRSRLTFAMITRLADLLLRINGSVREALALTYSHVFMDEFQDTTQGQFDLVKTIFSGTSTVLTAVGDNKQQIMKWALAMDDPFSAFQATYGAPRIRLLNNYRSSPELVRIQHVLAQAMDGNAVEPESQSASTIADSCCEIWDFSAAYVEAQCLASYIAAQIKDPRLKPRDFVLLVRQKADEYAQMLAPAFRAAGVSLRNEATPVGALALQELLAEPVSDLVLSLVRLSTTPIAGVAWPAAVQALAFLRGVAFDDDVARRRLDRELDEFADAFAAAFPGPANLAATASAVVDAIMQFVTRDALVAAYPAYVQREWLTQVENSVAQHLRDSCQNTHSWVSALDAYEGLHAVALMTLHKSKGLEYHTVVFVGLDDAAWWSFNNDTPEAKAGFFVAFTRAKQKVVFTYAAPRGQRQVIAPLYAMLDAAGVKPRFIA